MLLGVFLFLPMLPPIRIPLFFFNLLTAECTPSLLKPNLLISPSSSIRRNIRFFGFPSCATGVSVPISIKPKPKLANSLYNLASLSNPAASPTGFGKVKPKKFCSNLLSFKTYIKLNNLDTPGILFTNLIELKTK